MAKLVQVDISKNFSTNVDLCRFSKTTNWGEWMKAKERLAYRIKEIVEDEAGAGFAFPSSSIYVETLPFDKPEAFEAPTGERAEAAE